MMKNPVIRGKVFIFFNYEYNIIELSCERHKRLFQKQMDQRMKFITNTPDTLIFVSSASEDQEMTY